VSVVVLDVGSSSVRASTLARTGEIETVASKAFPVHKEGVTVVEYDANSIAATSLEVIEAALAHSKEPAEALAITTQRATSVIWDASERRALAPAISWQDLRTATQCLALGAQGVPIAPNESATKYSYLLSNIDKRDRRYLRLGTLDSWIANYLGVGHITDITNAAMSGLTLSDLSNYDEKRLAALGIERELLPEITPSVGELGVTRHLSENLPLLCLIGDQQASLFGQGCYRSGQAKATLGTGVMVDLNLGVTPPSFERRGAWGSYRIPTIKEKEQIGWGAEGVLLSGGSAIQWFCSTFLKNSPPSAINDLARSASPNHGCIFVPSLGGLATPEWDFGARGTFFGVKRVTGVAELADAVLQGVAHSVADIVKAVQNDTSIEITSLMVDGKMAQSDLLLRYTSAFSEVEVRRSKQLEATSLGAGTLAQHATEGVFDKHTSDPRENLVGETFISTSVITASADIDELRAQWARAKELSKQQIPALSAIRFS